MSQITEAIQIHGEESDSGSDEDSCVAQQKKGRKTLNETLDYSLLDSNDISMSIDDNAINRHNE